MNHAAAIHEGFMNASRMILPRVGEGVGVGVRGGFVVHPCLSPHQGRHPDAQHLANQPSPAMDGSLRSRVIGGGL